MVLQEVTDRSGLVKLTGETWTARTTSGAVLPIDQSVNVLRIEGATAIVEALSPVAGGSGVVEPDRPVAGGSGAAVDEPERPAGGTTHTESP